MDVTYDAFEMGLDFKAKWFEIERMTNLTLIIFLGQIWVMMMTQRSQVHVLHLYNILLLNK